MEPLGGRQVFLTFAPRPHLSLSEIRPKIYWKMFLKMSAAPYSIKFWGLACVWGRGRGGAKGGTIGERQLAMAAMKAINLHCRQAMKALESHLSYLTYICLSIKFFFPNIFNFNYCIGLKKMKRQASKQMAIFFSSLHLITCELL